jgi:asparagine synthase (glutamine-hydrolysing)
VSGFAGIVRIEPGAVSAETDRSAIELMARAIAFRGPDSLQQTHQNGASFAFSFLKTGPAPQEKTQPCTLNGETWLLGDVRCDGREEIVRKLAQHGVEVSSTASSERLLLQYFAKFGETGLPELGGDLSFVLWKPQERKLIAFRDLTGARPFFYAHRDGVLVFSNTMQAVLAVPSITRELDEEFLADFLLGAPDHNPSASVYRGIRRLPPGHLLEFPETGLSIRRIANMPVEDLLVLKSEEDYVTEFRRLLEQAVKDRLPSLDTTILLSGGLDSTTIAAVAVALRKATACSAQPELRAFSVDSQPLYDDPESAIASRFAAKLGIPCQVSHLGDVLPFEDWDEFPALLPEPPLDPYAILVLSHPRQIALTSRVGFSGMGCDELLRLQAMPYLRFLAKEGRLLAAVLSVTRYSLSQGKLPPLGAGIRSGIRRLFGKTPTSYFYPPWFAPDFERRLNIKERWRAIAATPHSTHPFNSRAYNAMNDLSVGNVFEQLDATWTACHMELRAPFMDRRLARFLLRIPPVPWAMEKFLVRRSQIGILPDEIRLRPKTPVLQDALLLHTSLGNFNPGRTRARSPLVESLVIWQSLINNLETARDQSLYLHLRPIALAHWLENVDKYGSVRYIL